MCDYINITAIETGKVAAVTKSCEQPWDQNMLAGQN